MRSLSRRLTSLVALCLMLGTFALPRSALASSQEVSGGRRDGDRVRGSFIVTLRRGVAIEQAADIARRHGGRATHVYGRLGGFAFDGPDAAASRLARDRRVKAVEADRLVRAVSEPKPDLKHMKRTDSYDAYDAGYTGAGVSIAVIDTGVQAKHKAFHDGQVLKGKSCVGGGTGDRQGHGTASAGNAAGRAGTAHDATIYAVKVFKGKDLFTPISKVVCGLNWVKAQNDSEPGKIDVVNLSLAYAGGSNALKAAVDAVRDGGAVVVAAAGNNGGKLQAPAKYASVIAVTALGGGTKMANFSASGGAMTAPGVNVVSPKRGGGFSKRSGTSRSAPIVAGAAAIVLAQKPLATPDEVEDVLRTSGTCPDGQVNGGSGFCPGRWQGDDPNAEPLVNAYCAGLLAQTGALDDPLDICD